MNILVTGSNGQLGRELADIKGNHPYKFYFVDIEDLDITDAKAVDAYVRSNQINAIINAAAYTAVDNAESDKKVAFKVNELGVANLAKTAKAYGCFLVHVSTDYVFDGSKSTPYLETDPTKPMGVYGASKLAGEEAVSKLNPHSVIVRTSWLYSRFGKNFVKTMMRLGGQKESLNVVADQIGCPTFAGDLAEALLALVAQKQKIKQPTVLHYSNTGKCSWCDFAQFIMEETGSNCKVNPIPTKDYPTPAKRPAYSLMSVEKIQKEFAVKSPFWKESAAACIKYLMDEESKNANGTASKADLPKEKTPQSAKAKATPVAVKPMKADYPEAFPAKVLIDIAKEAGAAILEVYNREHKVQVKDDKSPLTEADLASNKVIVAGLKKHFPEVPILSEETKAAPYSERKNWTLSWCVDPLDGTKEFIKRNGEFTVNIALIDNGMPTIGVIYVPVTGELFFAKKFEGAYKLDKNNKKSTLRIKAKNPNKGQIVASRSHLNDATKAFVEQQKKQFKEIELVPAGSSLKFCLVAEGRADIYPRLAPTMEWDTAAGQIVAEEAGAEVVIADTGKPVQYNKEDLLNPYFIVRPKQG